MNVVELISGWSHKNFKLSEMNFSYVHEAKLDSYLDAEWRVTQLVNWLLKSLFFRVFS